MKKIFTILMATLLTVGVFAQTPEKMSYQSIIRNNKNYPIRDRTVGIQISILQGSTTGIAVYTETHSPCTNGHGLASLIIGEGSSSDDFTTINWGSDSHFLKVDIDPRGGTNYRITSTSQLLSVPYAFHAKTAESVVGGASEIDPVYTSSEAANITATDITNLRNLPTGTQAGEMQYWNGSAWVSVAAGNEGQVLTFVSGVPTWKTQIPEVLNPTTGKTWMDRNLGASQVATSHNDANAYGDLYQWGRGADGHQIRTSGTTTTLSGTDTPGHANFILATSSYDWRSSQNDNLWQGVSGTNNPCPSGYRLPTETELNNERLSWSTNNTAGAYAGPLKLAVAGLRLISSGSLFNVGSSGYYWSSTVDGTGSRSLYIGSSDADMNRDLRAFGFSVRCIKD